MKQCKILLIARLIVMLYIIPLFYIGETTYINNIGFIYVFIEYKLLLYTDEFQNILEILYRKFKILNSK